MHMGQGPGLTFHPEGQMSGAEDVTLMVSQMPSHTHNANAYSQLGNQASPINHYWAGEAGGITLVYGTPANGTMNPNAVGLAGGNQSHENMQPFLVLNFVIALFGVFPPRS